MLGFALGALKFGASAIGAMGQHSAGQAAARAQNKYNKKIYNLKIKQMKIQYAQQVADYGNKKIQYEMQKGYNFDAANRAYVAEQERINEIQKQMGFAEQGSAVQQAQTSGKLQAREVSGRSADRQRVLADAGFQRNTAIRNEQFSTAIETATQRNKATRESLKIANTRAFWNVGQPPQPTELPPPPLSNTGPSSMGLFANLGNAALGAIQTGMNFANYDPGAGR